MLKRYLASSWAPWVFLTVMVAAHVVVTLLGADPFKMVDLDVYVQGTHHLFDGTLYDFATEPLDLPFTYPPFSALLFGLVGWIPWGILRFLWQAASLAAVAVIIHSTLKLLGRAGPAAPNPLPHLRSVVITGTAIALWLEPVRTTFNYGQINLFLAALLLAGLASTRQWVQGASVGLAAGIKLVPAITGLYYLLQRRWTAVASAVVSFAVTVGIALIFLPSETVRFFTKLMLDPSRTGPVFSAINQSWRGALERFAGHEVSGAWMLAAVLTVVVGGVATWVAIRAGDKVGAFLAVQFIGLLVSPISWSHHWVWVLPLLLWLLFGPYTPNPAHPRKRTSLVLAIGWLAATGSYLVSIMISLQDKTTASRPGWQSWISSAYAVLGMLTLLAVWWLNAQAARASRESAAQRPGPATPPG